MTLHCPARLLLTGGAGLDDPRVGSLADQRIMGVYCDVAGVATATEVAARWGLPAHTRPDLAAREPAALRGALEAIADLHRGEAVLVVTAHIHVPTLRVLAVDTRGSAGHDVPVELECGDDGWFIRSWPGL